MKLPWIRSPTSVGLGTETPTPKPSMARPRRMLLEALITKPMSVGPLGIWLPSMITRTCALLPSIAAVVLGTDVIKVVASIDASDGRRLNGCRRIDSGQVAGRDQVGDRLLAVDALERDGHASRS